MLSMLFCLSVAAGFAFAAVVLSEDVQTAGTAIPLPVNTETLVVLGRSLTLPGGSAKAVIRGWVDVIPGAGTTAVVLSIYAGDAMDLQLIGQKMANAGNFTPGDAAHFELEVVDSLQDVGSARYCFSVQQQGAAADGSVLAALLDTTLLSG